MSKSIASDSWWGSTWEHNDEMNNVGSSDIYSATTGKKANLTYSKHTRLQCVIVSYKQLFVFAMKQDVLILPVITWQNKSK